MIVIVEINNSPQLQMPCQRSGLRRDAFHQITVGHNSIDIRLDNFMSRFIEGASQMCRGNCHTNTLTESLTQWARRHFNSWGESVFWMAGCDTPKLTEVFDFIKRYIVAC